MPCLFYDSPIGPMTLVQEGEALARLDFDVPSQPEEATPLLLEACRQLREYFAGERKAFALRALAPHARNGPGLQQHARVRNGLPHGFVPGGVWQQQGLFARAVHVQVGVVRAQQQQLRLQ